MASASFLVALTALIIVGIRTQKCKDDTTENIEMKQPKAQQDESEEPIYQRPTWN